MGKNNRRKRIEKLDWPFKAKEPHYQGVESTAISIPHYKAKNHEYYEKYAAKGIESRTEMRADRRASDSVKAKSE